MGNPGVEIRWSLTSWEAISQSNKFDVLQLIAAWVPPHPLQIC